MMKKSNNNNNSNNKENENEIEIENSNMTMWKPNRTTTTCYLLGEADNSLMFALDLSIALPFGGREELFSTACLARFRMKPEFSLSFSLRCSSLIS